MKVLAKSHVFQPVGQLCAAERALPPVRSRTRARHKIQAQDLSGILDQTNDRQFAIAVFQNGGSHYYHGFAPIPAGARGRHNTGGTPQADAVDTRECSLDKFGIGAADVVLQPAQDDAETVV